MALLSTDRLDRLLTDDWDITIGKSAFGINGVVQRVKVRLQMFREEWFLDQRTGVPYFQKLLGHKFRRVTAIAAFREEILKVQGVAQIRQLDVQFDSKVRAMTVNFNLRTEFGDVVSSLTIEV